MEIMIMYWLEGRYISLHSFILDAENVINAK
jgi:hypothetical protein